MKFFIFLSLFISTIAEKGRMYKRIINGSPIKIRKVPYYASLVMWKPEFSGWIAVCGTSIISEYWQASAGHCVRPEVIDQRKIRTGFDEFLWVEGVHDNELIHEIDFPILHPDYMSDSGVNSNDIGLIKLKIPLTLEKNTQWPIMLPDPDCIPKPDSRLTIMGLGLQTINNSGGKNYFSPRLLHGEVQIRDHHICEQQLARPKPASLICATSKKHTTGVCDSGGPAVQHSVLTGIISSGSSGKVTHFDLLTAVHQFVKWIKQETGIENFAPLSSEICCNIL